MSSVISFIHRCQYAYSVLDLPGYQECTETGALFGYSYQLDGITYQVQLEQASTLDGVMHIHVRHVDSNIIEMNVPSSVFFAELDKSVQAKLDREEVIHHA